MSIIFRLATMSLGIPYFWTIFRVYKRLSNCFSSFLIEAKCDMTIRLSGEILIFISLNILSLSSNPIRITVRTSLFLNVSRSIEVVSLPLIYWRNVPLRVMIFVLVILIYLISISIMIHQFTIIKSWSIFFQPWFPLCLW